MEGTQLYLQYMGLIGTYVAATILVCVAGGNVMCGCAVLYCGVEFLLETVF